MGPRPDIEKHAGSDPAGAESVMASSRLPSDNPEESLDLLAHRVRAAVNADLVAVLAEVSGGMHVLGGVDGIGAQDLRGLVLGPANGSRLWRELLAESRPYIVDDVSDDERLNDITPPLTLGRLMMIPLVSGGLSIGALLLAAVPARDPFGTLDLEVATAFARRVTEALELIRSEEVGRRLKASEDHGSVARDMHDEVLQRLFAVGLRLQGVTKSVVGPSAEALTAAMAELQDTTTEIRSSIFSLRAQAAAGPTLRDDLLDIALAAIETLGFDIHLRTVGTVDMAFPTLRRALRVVLEEALAAVAHHGVATRVDVLVEVTSEDVCLTMSWNGQPLPLDAQQSLLDSGYQRLPFDGAIEIDPTTNTGTTLIWRAPIPEELRE